MADVIVTKRTTKVVVENVELNLSMEEAYFLHRLLGAHIVGNGKWREVSSDIFNALQDSLGDIIGTDPDWPKAPIPTVMGEGWLKLSNA